MRHIRVNVRNVTNAKPRDAMRNGRKVKVVPSATLPDNVVMNELMYPADEIEKSYMGLERSAAPFGHPMINGKFISAHDPEGINVGYVGAWNENVRRENGRVFMDKVIDIEVANRSENGRALLAALDQGEPIHTSTGLYCNVEECNDDSLGYKGIARDIVWDHDAVLLNEEGAATPEQGVGIYVNSEGNTEELDVINSSLEDMADQELDWAALSIVRAMDQREKASIADRIKAVLLEMFSGGRETQTIEEEENMTVTKEQFEELSAKVNGLAESISSETLGKAIGEAVANAVKPLTDNLAEMQANQKAQEEAKKAELVAKVVKANVLSEDAAKELTVNALTELAAKAEPGKAAPINPNFGNAAKDEGFKLPEGDD